MLVVWKGDRGVTGLGWGVGMNSWLKFVGGEVIGDILKINLATTRSDNSTTLLDITIQTP